MNHFFIIIFTKRNDYDLKRWIHLIYDWIIIGGGIQGSTLANFLLKEKKTTVERLAIIDPHEEPLANWKHCTGLIDMPYLRSPSVHHIDSLPFSLQEFNKIKGETKNFYGRYKRPSLDLFNEHCRHVIEDTRLNKCWHQGKVIHAERTGNLWTIQTEIGQAFTSYNLVLSVGIGNQLAIPDWAQENPNAQHIFDPALHSLEEVKSPVAVIGGGITAVHTAVKLSSLYPGNVTLIKRHPFRIHDFDSDPAWLGPKKQHPFRRLSSYRKRRELIKEARHKGSIPQELFLKVKRLTEKGHLSIVDGEVDYYDKDTLHLKEGLTIEAKRVILATGFVQTLPEKQWLTPLIHEHKLNCSDCGYPIVSHSLQWGPNLYVTGALAELEVGPIARNISGARQAAQLIVNSL